MSTHLLIANLIDVLHSGKVGRLSSLKTCVCVCVCVYIYKLNTNICSSLKQADCGLSTDKPHFEKVPQSQAKSVFCKVAGRSRALNAFTHLRGQHNQRHTNHDDHIQL